MATNSRKLCCDFSSVLSCVSWRPLKEPPNWPHMIGRLCWEQSYSNLHAVLVGSQWGMHAGWNAPCSCVDSMARHSDGMSLDVLMLCSITHAIRMNGTMTGYDVVHGTKTCVVLSSRRLGAAQIRASLSFAFKLWELPKLSWSRPCLFCLLIKNWLKKCKKIVNFCEIP